MFLLSGRELAAATLPLTFPELSESHWTLTLPPGAAGVVFDNSNFEAILNADRQGCGVAFGGRHGQVATLYRVVAGG